MSSAYKDVEEDWLTVCLKYLLFVFNSLFWVGGAAVLGVGVWTLVEKSEFLSLLASSTFAVSAYILILAGGLVVVTGFLGCCAVIREQRRCLSMYFFGLLLIFLIELVAGVLAYVYCQRLSEELKQHLKQTMTDNYAQPGKEAITLAVDKLQQDFKCCGSDNYQDWTTSVYIMSKHGRGRLVPDSCCKSMTPDCGVRDHPSNIYNVEGGCITKLEQFLADHLLVIGAVGIGVACLQERTTLGTLEGGRKFYSPLTVLMASNITGMTRRSQVVQGVKRQPAMWRCCRGCPHG
ncbi:tetraspanin-11 isoform X2 [Dunckerocampus dactyliophorus]|uniref:tetraspanin-11 isoform X2 n=1 Tax=Dunckerocampus dactyliophorus TaxID=161453 RepID=UPI00240709B6|nr:tetraspanin-11 isoform X2 [Dunckerocampus dactyliophorus]